MKNTDQQNQAIGQTIRSLFQETSPSEIIATIARLHLMATESPLYVTELQSDQGAKFALPLDDLTAALCHCDSILRPSQ